MPVRSTIHLIISIVMTFTPFGHAETLVAAGRLHDAEVVLSKIALEQVKDFARTGVNPRDLGVYLSVRYPGPADQRYLRGILAKISDQTTIVKIRAFDEGARG